MSKKLRRRQDSEGSEQCSLPRSASSLACLSSAFLYLRYLGKRNLPEDFLAASDSILSSRITSGRIIPERCQPTPGFSPFVFFHDLVGMVQPPGCVLQPHQRHLRPHLGVGPRARMSLFSNRPSPPRPDAAPTRDHPPHADKAGVIREGPDDQTGCTFAPPLVELKLSYHRCLLTCLFRSPVRSLRLSRKYANRSTIGVLDKMRGYPVHITKSP